MKLALVILALSLPLVAAPKPKHHGLAHIASYPVRHPLQSQKQIGQASAKVAKKSAHIAKKILF